MKIPKLKKVLPLVNGLFAHIDYQFWDFEPLELDMIFLSKVAMRSEAPLISMVRMTSEELPESIRLTDSQLTVLGQLLLKMFKPKWDRLMELPFMEYNILYNYLDIYEEVLRDETSQSTDRTSNNASSNFISSLSESSMGSEANTDNNSSSNMSSTRGDEFSGTFTRNTVSDNVRTDNLVEHNAERENLATTVANNLTNGTITSEHYASQRVDDLTENKASEKSVQSTDSKMNAKSAATLNTDDPQRTDVASSETENSENNNADSIYGFNSESAVPTNEGNTSRTGNLNKVESTTIEQHESSVINKEVSSQQNSQEAIDKNVESKANQGTVSDAGEKTTTTTITNGGHNITSGDKKLAGTKVNEGTQNNSEATMLSDVTLNSDSQESSSEISTNSTIDNTNSSTASIEKLDKQKALSKLEENSVVSGALARAKNTIHKGNLGNIAPQDLIKKEIELWRWNFINEVMDDIKNTITLAIYD